MSEADDIFGFGPDYADHPSPARPELLRRYADGIGEDLKRATFEGTEPVWWIGTAPNKLRHAADLIEAQAARIAELERERDEAKKLLSEAGAVLCKAFGDDAGTILAKLVAAEARATAAEAERDKLRAALEPFADFARRNTDEHGWGGTQCQRERICDWFGPTDFRRARAALAQTEPSGNSGWLDGEQADV